MTRYIEESEAISVLSDYYHHRTHGQNDALREAFSRVPTADVVERKRGKWEEMKVIHKDEAEDLIEEWQSCRCSVCGRYHTQPYMYYFDKPNFCSWCGADMRKETEDG